MKLNTKKNKSQKKDHSKKLPKVRTGAGELPPRVTKHIKSSSK